LEIGKNAETFYFGGENSEGQTVALIQHYTQVIVILTAVTPAKGDAPRRIGFLDETSA
jgi:hypothetical protein